MQLPGGLWTEGRLRRDFAFRPLTGAMERALQEAATADACFPDRVTKALSVSLAHIGGTPPTAEAVAGLAVGDRQFLMRLLSVPLEMNRNWMTARCDRCGESFDFWVDHERLPVKTAGEGFPFAEVETTCGRLRFRVPSGADQAALAGVADPDAVHRLLVGRCLSPGDPMEDRERMAVVDGLTAGDFEGIESAIETVAPEVTTRIRANCSECEAAHQVEVDPYFVLGRAGVHLDHEIHVLAATYHWSETDILQLPTRRRRTYLDLIDQDRGMRS